MSRSVAVALVSLLLAGCEPMPSSGDIFSPVPATPPAGAPSASSAVVSESEPVLGPALVVKEGGPGPDLPMLPATPTVEPGAEGTVADGAPAPGSPTAPEIPAPAVPDAPVAPGAVPVGASLATPTAVFAPSEGWPVRLVATVPGAQPPRAILGLPGGEELVVTPGTMVPGANLIVVAIGRQTVDVAEITAVGDHATVKARTLHALQ